MFMLQRCLCNLLGWCLPNRGKTAGESEVVADAPAPIGSQPGEQTRQRSARKPADDGGEQRA